MAVGAFMPLLNIQLHLCRNSHSQLISLQWLSEWLQLLWPHRATTLGPTREPYKAGKRATRQPGSHGSRELSCLCWTSNSKLHSHRNCHSQLISLQWLSCNFRGQASLLPICASNMLDNTTTLSVLHAPIVSLMWGRKVLQLNSLVSLKCMQKHIGQILGHQ